MLRPAVLSHPWSRSCRIAVFEFVGVCCDPLLAIKPEAQELLYWTKVSINTRVSVGASDRYQSMMDNRPGEVHPNAVNRRQERAPHPNEISSVAIALLGVVLTPA